MSERKLSNDEKKQITYLQKRKDELLENFIGACTEINKQIDEVKNGAWAKKFNEPDTSDLELAKQIISCIDHVTTSDNPEGSGYFTICENKYIFDDEEIKLQIAIEGCLYEDPDDHHRYYGLYSFAEISGGPNISESEWDYTDTESELQLSELITTLRLTFTRDYLRKLYKKEKR